MNTTLTQEEFVRAGGWEEYARCYDAILTLTPYITMMYDVIKEILPSLQQASILDASCGTGNFEHILSEYLLEHPFDGPRKVFGIDSSKTMLARARQKYYSTVNVAFEDADLNQRIPAADGEYDVVVSINTLYAVESPEKTLREFFRALRKGGRCVLVTPKQGFENGLILKAHAKSKEDDSFWAGVHSSEEREHLLIGKAIDDDTMREMMLRVARYNRYIAKHGVFHFFTKETLSALFEYIGFSVKKTFYTYADQGIIVVANKP
jgi:SAM-dependent methyltransferase